MCANVLARLVNKEVERRAIKGVKVSSRAATISQLFYADDVILFCGAKISEVDVLMRCIEKYCLWSGQSISVKKSGLFVSKGVHHNFIVQVKNQWLFKQLAKGVRYLSVPLFLTRNKSKDFAFVKEKLEARTNGYGLVNLFVWRNLAFLSPKVCIAILLFR